MRKRQLFGANISPDCSYCQNGILNGQEYLCCMRRKIIDGKCRKFDYNPTLRVPAKKPEIAKLPKEDFKL